MGNVAKILFLDGTELNWEPPKRRASIKGEAKEDDALEIVREALRSAACASIGESMDLINCQMTHPKEVRSQIRTDRAARRARSRRRG